MPVETPIKFAASAELMGDIQVSSPPKTLFDRIPLGLVMFLARPYLAGDDPESAIRHAHHIYAQDKFASTLDILGEDSNTDEQCEAIVTSYQQLIDAVQANRLQCEKPRQQMTISMKPSMFSTLPPVPGKDSERALEQAFDRITRVVDYAMKNDVSMTLEAEDHRWANFHLEAYFALINAGYTNLGTVLQTRLFRTEKDVARFDERMRVRLVIGIYNEPAQIAHTDKRNMKELVVTYAQQLLRKGTYVELATHDAKCVENFYRNVAVPQKIGPENFEHQFLLGVPRAKMQKGLVSGAYFADLARNMPSQYAEQLERLERRGTVVRMYLPYGTPRVSGAYCRRRLRENPNMITYGIKNALHIH